MLNGSLKANIRSKTKEMFVTGITDRVYLICQDVNLHRNFQYAATISFNIFDCMIRFVSQDIIFITKRVTN